MTGREIRTLPVPAYTLPVNPYGFKNPWQSLSTGTDQVTYDELGYAQTHPTTIRGDNNGSIAMAKNPQFHQRSKHIAIQWHLIQDLVNDDVLVIEECRDPEQKMY